MIAISIGIACLTILIAQFRTHAHERIMQAEGKLLYKVEERVSALERKRNDQFDPAAFEELKTKVEALRMAQGLRGMR